MSTCFLKGNYTHVSYKEIDTNNDTYKNTFLNTYQDTHKHTYKHTFQDTHLFMVITLASTSSNDVIVPIGAHI